MATDVFASSIDGSGQKFPGDAGWRASMADFEHWAGSLCCFCAVPGVSLKTIRGWLGLTARRAKGHR